MPPQSPLALDPGTKDSGAFTFDDMSSPLQRLKDFVAPPDVSLTIGHVDADAALLDDEEVDARCGELGPRDGMASSSLRDEEMWEARKAAMGGSTEEAKGEGHALLEPMRDAPTCPAMAPSRPAPLRQAPPPPPQESRPSSLALRDNPTSKPASPAQSTRLHRPTELNLTTITSSAAKPQSELEKRFSLMRDSTTQVKAALRSPTQLLKQRLSTSTKKNIHDEKNKDRSHAFVPPQPSLTGCILPGPGAQVAAFTSASVRARTSHGRPAWWCKVDALVVFDGISNSTVQTRTSKGLSIARRRGDTEVVVIPLDCAHCQTMLNRTEWKYDVQVCRRGVCGECRERCRWEREQEVEEQRKEEAKEQKEVKEGGRVRADSVLQDEDAGEEVMLKKMGIEREWARSPIEGVGGIEERMGV
jgi:hypothetical protein